MDELTPNLLQLRAQHSWIIDQTPATAAENHQQQQHHVKRRSTLSKALPDEGNEQPALPIRAAASLRPAINKVDSVVSSVADLQLLCEHEFQRTSLNDRSDELPKFKYEEIVQGKLLGKGGFSTVYEVRGFDLFRSSRHSHFSSGMPDASDLSSDHDEEDDALFDAFVVKNRQFIANHCTRHESGEARFAVKRLRQDVRKDHDKMLRGMADIVRECHFLGMIDHPNIVRLRAVSFDSKFDDGYFIVIDRLYDTLTKRIDTWRRQKKRVSGMIMRHFRDRNGERRAKLGEDVTMAQFELASALTYLHSKKIIYRDLKTDNVGFDIRGDLRLFDLGLAKELDAGSAVGDGLYMLTACCGTPRYMASEVASGRPYNEKCDVYSFALVCWQMASLKLPYEKLDLLRLRKQVWAGAHNRPPIQKKWPEFFKRLLCESWNHSPKLRPTMKEIESILAKEVGKHKKEFDLRSHLLKRRSSIVMHKVESMRIAGGSKEVDATTKSVESEIRIQNPYLQQ